MGWHPIQGGVETLVAVSSGRIGLRYLVTRVGLDLLRYFQLQADCSLLFCTTDASSYCVSKYSPPVDGTYCGGRNVSLLSTLL